MAQHPGNGTGRLLGVRWLSADGIAWEHLPEPEAPVSWNPEEGVPECTRKGNASPFSAKSAAVLHFAPLKQALGVVAGRQGEETALRRAGKGGGLELRVQSRAPNVYSHAAGGREPEAMQGSLSGPRSHVGVFISTQGASDVCEVLCVKVFAGSGCCSVNAFEAFAALWIFFWCLPCKYLTCLVPESYRGCCAGGRLSLQSLLCSHRALSPAPLPTPKSTMEKCRRGLGTWRVLMLWGTCALPVLSFSLTPSADWVKDV